MIVIRKILTFFLDSWWKTLLLLEISTGLIVFCATFAKIMMPNSVIFQQMSWIFFEKSSNGFEANLLFAIIAIILFYISTFIDSNKSVQESLGQLAAVVAFLGIFNIFLLSLSDPNPRDFHNDPQNSILKVIFSTLEYLYFSSIYLFSVVGTYMFFFYFRNRE